MLDYLGRTLERSQFDVEFRRYGHVILWFALIVCVLHLAEHFAIVYHYSPNFIRGLKAGQFVLMLLVLWRYRSRGILPTTTAERLLWSVWIGYIIACTTIGFLIYHRFGADVLYEGVLYPIFCVITCMAYIVLGSTYWGMCYVIAGIFFVAALLLPLAPWWGALTYGGLWTLALLTIGLRLRKLGLERGPGE
jgi:serine/threonine-protein kinase